MAISTGLAIAAVAGAGLAGAAANKGFYRDPKNTTTKALGLAPKLPELNSNVSKTQLMPTPNQDKIQKSRLNALQSLQQRSGRASTLLTSQSTQNNTFG